MTIKNGSYDEAVEFLVETIHSFKHQRHVASWMNVGSIQLWNGEKSFNKKYETIDLIKSPS